MKLMQWTAAIVIALIGTAAQAADVSIKDTHLCCGQCVTLAKGALKDVKGVSDAAADQKAREITFKATDEAAAKAGMEALAKAGFHGTATIDKKKADFPAAKIEEKKTKSLTVTNVHLCCGQCVTGVKKALEGVKNVADPKIDREAGTVTATSDAEIDVAEFVAALNKAGFHAEVKK